MERIPDTIDALGVGEVTTVGFARGEKYPRPDGNCFSVVCSVGEYRIVNFNHANLEEAVRRGVEWPIAIRPISPRHAIIHDPRIPGNWYDDDWCEICCPTDLLPLPQRLAHERQVAQGIREVRGGFVKIQGSPPTLEE